MLIELYRRRIETSVAGTIICIVRCAVTVAVRGPFYYGCHTVAIIVIILIVGNAIAVNIVVTQVEITIVIFQVVENTIGIVIGVDKGNEFTAVFGEILIYINPHPLY